jgi:hypothetical protein
MPEPCIPADINILVAHQFLVGDFSGFVKNEAFSSEQVIQSGWNFLFLGHDHILYPVSDLGGKTIVRPGALSRGTKHIQNRVRDVCFNIVTVSEKGVEIEQKSLPVEPAESIYSMIRIERDDVSKKMTEFITNLKDKSKQDITSDIGTALWPLCSGDTVLFNFIKQYFTNFGVSV